MKYVVEPGEFEIMVGNSSRDDDLQKVSPHGGVDTKWQIKSQKLSFVEKAGYSLATPPPTSSS